MVEGPRTTLTPPSSNFVGPMPETTGPMPPVDAGTGQPVPLDSLKENMGLMQKFSNLLGDTPEERAQNAKVFSALVKDVGNIGKTVADSTLMQRMMKSQMGGPSVVTSGSASGGVGGIQPSNAGAPIMNSLGFR